MLGWKRRYLFLTDPFFLPREIRVEEKNETRGPGRWISFFLFLFLVFGLTLGARLLELPYWDNPEYRLDGEYLLATHDAYHWLAGAEDFEFGAGHPMSETARLLGELTGKPTAAIAFWLPPFMGALLAVGVFLWAWGLGHPFAGVCAGVLSSLAPTFFARTLLGFFDTDLVVLLFALLLGLVPALWLTPWLTSVPEMLYAACAGRFSRSKEWNKAAVPPRWFFGENTNLPGALWLSELQMQRAMLACPWIVMLLLAGLFGHWIRDWHSLFPYLVNFSALLLPALVLVLGPRGGRHILLVGGLCYSLPLLCGALGALNASCYYVAFVLSRPSSARPPDTVMTTQDIMTSNAWHFLLRLKRRLLSAAFWHALLRHPLFILPIWLLVVILALDASVYDAMLRSFSAYVNREGDIAASAAVAADPLVFPSVAQSVIEVQTITLKELLVYVYPVEILTLVAFVLFAYRLAVTPAFVWLLPLLALSLLSLRMGARMIMFGPPVLLLALCMEAGFLLELLFFRLLLPKILERRQGIGGMAGSLWAGALRLGLCLACTVCLAWPLISLLPEYAQGPIISRKQAEALRFIRENTQEDSLVWNWWDWGYATHHFARRHSIADGARHGGPSLFLPAAVYTTADPRFARQLIKYTATKDNIPGKVFEGFSAQEAQQLMRDLGDSRRALVSAPGKQYLVVSFELLRLGLWVTRYGSWNFETKQASGSLMNNLSQAIEFNTATGVIQPDNASPVYAGSIDIFEPGRIERFSYNRYGAYHFIFNPPKQERVSPSAAPGPLERFWTWQRGSFAFPTGGNDKMVVDSVFYNTMMVQLLLCSKDDPSISPYFKLVFDNIYTRIYEVK